MYQHLFVYLDWVKQMVKSIDRCVVVDYEGDLKLLEYTNSKMEPLLLGDKKSQTVLANLLNSNKKSEWFVEDELPFSNHISLETTKQLSINRESERNILLLKLERNTSQVAIFLYLQDINSLLSLTKVGDKLNKESRRIIEALLSTSLSTYFELYYKIQDMQVNQAAYQKHLKAKSILKQSIHRETAVNQQFTIASFVQNLLLEIENEQNFKLRISNKGLDYLCLQKIVPAKLKDQLIQFAAIKGMNPLEGVIEIDELDLEWLFNNLLNAPNDIQDTNLEPQIGRYSKTMQLLDKYEEAANQALRNQESIIGKNIAKYCVPQVSNAAITDALKKHKERVLHVLDDYPNRWPVLRNRFRSIHNLVEKAHQKRNMA